MRGQARITQGETRGKGAHASDITEYFYDNRNRLTEVKQWSTWTVYNNGNGTPDLADVAYTYDAFDRLVDRIATVPSSGGGSTSMKRGHH